MKKILSVIMSVFIVMTIMCATPVLASSEADIDISVDVAFYDITVTVKSEYDNMTAILKNKANTQLYGMYSNYSPAVENGVKVHTFNFKMPDDVAKAPTGKYVVYVGNETAESSKELNFVRVSDKVAFYNALNDKTADELKAFFTHDDYKNTVPVDLTDYIALETKSAKVFGMVNNKLKAFADTYQDVTASDLSALEELDVNFKDVFSQTMDVSELGIVDESGWASLADAKIDNGDFDSKYYVTNENTSVKLNLDDVFSYYDTERASIETLDLSEYVVAFDKATLSLLSTADVGTFKTGFIYFKGKPSITVSEADWTNINSLITAGKDTTLWENIKKKTYANCDAMVTDVGVEALALINSGILNSTTGGVSSPSIDRPVIPSGSGTVSGGNTPEIKPVEPSLTGSFTDVLKTHWAYEAIEELADKGILLGKGDGKFAPNDSVTREEFVKIIVAAFELSEEGAECDFSDVAKDSWSYPYIAAANKLGIVSGTGTSFNPKSGISRQDMAVIIHRVFEHLGLEVSGDAINFNDNADIAEYAKDAVETLTAAGIINGMGDGVFAPCGTVTRAQAAKVVYGLLNLVGGGK